MKTENHPNDPKNPRGPNTTSQNQTTLKTAPPTCQTQPFEFLSFYFFADVGLHHPLAMLEKDGRFYCSVCGRTYLYKQDCKRHLESHTGKTMCPMCRRSFSSLCYLKKHLEKIHGQLR
jgi:uncharacterized protein YbaR (Trm112 family)